MDLLPAWRQLLSCARAHLPASPQSCCFLFFFTLSRILEFLSLLPLGRFEVYSSFLY